MMGQVSGRVVVSVHPDDESGKGKDDGECTPSLLHLVISFHTHTHSACLPICLSLSVFISFSLTHAYMHT